MLDNWAASRFLVPSIRTGHGSGTRRLYSFSDIAAARVARDLRRAGIPLQSLRVVIKRLQKQGFTVAATASALAGVRLLVSGKDVLIVNGKEEYISVLRNPGQMHLPYFVADLGVVRELALRARAMRAAA
jgi:DNA-binding transcriptional MerR regulator